MDLCVELPCFCLFAWRGGPLRGLSAVDVVTVVVCFALVNDVVAQSFYLLRLRHGARAFERELISCVDRRLLLLISEDD